MNNTGTNKIETESESFDQTFQPNRKQDVERRMRVVGRVADTNEVDAGRSPNMIEAVKTASTTRTLAVEQFTRTFNQQDLTDLGLAIRNNDLVDIGDFDANFTKSITEGGKGIPQQEMLAVKNRIKSLFKKLKDEETTETATREYNVCRRS